MKRLIPLLIIAAAFSTQSFAQEIPADLKAKIAEKAVEVHKASKSAQKTWTAKQISAWESIQNLSFAADPEDVAMIKKLAEQKFPLDFISQESFINEQAVAAGGMPDLKAQIGKDIYASIKAEFEKSGKTDLNELISILNAQITAKGQLAVLKPLPSVDEMTFSIAKEVAKKKYPNDYVAQLAAISKLSNAVSSTSTASAAATTSPATSASDTSTASTTQEAQSATTEKKSDAPLTMAELNIKARDMYNKHALSVEGEVKATAIPVKIMGKNVILSPFKPFASSPSVTIMNQLGEPIEYDNTNVYASKNLPFVIVLPKALPESTKVVNLSGDEDYRKLIGKNIFFMGQTLAKIQIFPIKISSISDFEVLLSSRVPNNFYDGTILLSPTEEQISGIMILQRPDYSKVDLRNQYAVRILRRDIDKVPVFMTCLRTDKFGNWEKVDYEKLAVQKKKTEDIHALTNDLLTFMSATRTTNLVSCTTIGPVIEKYMPQFKRRMEKSRFDRTFRSYLQDLQLLVKKELRGVNPQEFYSLFKHDLLQDIKILTSIQAHIENALRTNTYTTLITEDIKRFQTN